MNKVYDKYIRGVLVILLCKNKFIFARGELSLWLKAVPYELK